APDARASRPGDLDVDPASEELDRRIWVVEEGQRVRLLVAADGDDRGEAPRIALDWHVVRRRDEHRAPEVGAVRGLVEDPGDLALRRRKAHVHDVEALLDGPAQAGQEDVSAAREARAEHADARQLAVRCERADDPGARRSVSAEVAFGVWSDDRLVV